MPLQARRNETWTCSRCKQQGHFVLCVINNIDGHYDEYLNHYFEPDEDVTHVQISMKITEEGPGLRTDELFLTWWDKCREDCHMNEQRYNTMSYSAVYKHHIVKYSPYIERRQNNNN